MKIVTELIKNPTQDTAVQIGLLMPDLSTRRSSQPVSLDRLTSLAQASDKALVVAKHNDVIVGCAVLNLIVTLGRPKAWLEDFVVSSKDEIRGKGVGYALWQAIIAWTVKNNASLEFTSSEKRVDAHTFYKKQGARIKDTSVFLFEPK